jgi:ABC-2 type transport system permease protein
MGLGIAFRNRPADVLPVGATTPQLTQALAADKGLTATMDEAARHARLATGRFCCWRFRARNGVAYKYDDTNPDARTARLLADRAIQTAAGGAMRCRPGTIGARDRRALHRLCCAGIAGHEPDGLGDVGAGFFDCRGAAEEAAEAAGGFAHAEVAVPGVVSAVAAGDADYRGCFLSGICAARVWRAVSRIALWQLGLLCLLTSLAFSALGLLVSSRAKTMEAVSGLMNLVMLPMWILVRRVLFGDALSRR